MKNFQLYYPCNVTFGKGVEVNAGKEAAKYGKKVLLHYDAGDFLEKSGLLGRVRDSLKAEGLEIVELGGVVPNPRLSLMREGMKLAKDEGVDVIVAVGGGSTMDSAKTIALGVANEDIDVVDMAGWGIAQKTLPVVVVPTMSGTGSEISICAMVYNDEVEPANKFGIIADCVAPKSTLINPELQFTLPKKQAAAGMMDIISQVMTTWFTENRDVYLTDRIGEATMQAVVKYGPVALENPDCYEAREQICLAASLGAFLMVGYDRNGREVGHGLENPLTTMHNLAHGQGLALVTPSLMKYTYKRDPERFAQWAHAVMGVEIDTFDLEGTALEGIIRFEHFINNRLGLATHLSDLGLADTTDIDYLVKKVGEGRGYPLNGGSPYELSEQDVRNIYEMCK